MGGDDSARALPVPIPNTEVKPRCADGTAGVTLWESRTSPPTFLALWSILVDIPPTQSAGVPGGQLVLMTATYRGGFRRFEVGVLGLRRLLPACFTAYSL